MAIELRKERVGGLWVATLTLEHAKVNVIDQAHSEELTQKLRNLREEDSVRIIVIRGAGRCFSTGVDIKQHTPELMPQLLPAFHGIFHELLKVRALTIAAVHGFCLGGAAELALACDRTIAHTDTVFSFPEIKVGCYPPVAISLLRERVGHSRALEMIASGEAVSVAQLVDWGAISRVSDDRTLDRAIGEEIELYQDKSPAVLGMIASLMHEQAQRSWGSQLAEAERRYLDELLQHADAAEGIKAFGEKRAARWLDASA